MSACLAAPTPDFCHRQTRASGFFGHSHCALHLNPAEKVPAPKACGSPLTAMRKRIRLAPLQSGIGLPCSADTRLFYTSQAQCSVKPVPHRLWRARCTLSAVNRLVLHFHSLQARCFAASDKGCRWHEPTRSPALCSSHAKRCTAL